MTTTKAPRRRGTPVWQNVQKAGDRLESERQSDGGSTASAASDSGSGGGGGGGSLSSSILIRKIRWLLSQPFVYEQFEPSPAPEGAPLWYQVWLVLF